MYNEIEIIRQSIRKNLNQNDCILREDIQNLIKNYKDVLIAEFEISYEALAIYEGLVVEDVKGFMDDTNSISIKKKYKLAVASLFLHHSFKRLTN